MDIMNKGNNPNNFNGDVSSEREIIIHALNWFENLTPEFITRIFPNVHEQKQLSFIEAVLLSCTLFEEHYAPTAIHKVFKITSQALKSVLSKGAEKTYDEHLENLEKNKTFQVNQTFNAGRDIIGSGSFHSDLDLRPIINPPTAETVQPNKQESKTSFGKFIIKHIVPIVITIGTGLIVAYLSYRFHWFG